MLGGRTVQVRQNIRACFKALVKRFHEILVWVDAISINQFDEGEKSAQVQMMGQIFKSASRVFVWLGVGNSNTDLVFWSEQHQRPHEVHEEHFQPNIEQQRLAFHQLFSNPYWTRIWTLQERALAKELWVLCGDQMELWANVKNDFAQLSKLRQRGLLSTKEESEYLGWDNQVPVEHDPQQERSLVELMVKYRHLRCTDARDKAYGLRNLSKDGHKLVVDYSKPVLQVAFEILSFDPGHPYFNYFRLVRSFPLSQLDIRPHLEPSGRSDFSLCTRKAEEERLLHTYIRIEPVPMLSSKERLGLQPQRLKHYKIGPFRDGPSTSWAFYCESKGQLRFEYLIYNDDTYRFPWYETPFRTCVRDILQTFWENGHIYPCNLPDAWPDNDKSIRLHYSRLALLASDTLSLLAEPGGSDLCEVQSLFPLIREAVRASTKRDLELPCPCVSNR